MIGESVNKRRLAAALLAGVAALLSSCATTSSVRDVKAPEEVRSTDRFQKEYVLAVEDQIEVIVHGAPEVSRTVVIRPDGKISLPLMNEVQAAGLTFRKLEQELTERFSHRFREPEVSVIGVRVRQPVVFVAGEVNTPAVVPLRDAPTAAQAIAVAGGFRKSAATKLVTLIRLSKDGHLRAIPVSGTIEGEAGRFMELRLAVLEPDDMIFVPESGRSHFVRFLEDFVNRPLVGITSLFSTYANWIIINDIND